MQIIKETDLYFVLLIRLTGTASSEDAALWEEKLLKDAANTSSWDEDLISGESVFMTVIFMPTSTK